MSDPSGNRVVRAFAELRASGRKALVPFITAGFPDLETTEDLLREFSARGVRICELGIPFSDPVADGPVIQASYTDALAGGITWSRIADMVRRFRGSGREISDLKSVIPESETRNPKSEIALLAMVSYSIVFRHGAQAFLTEARQAGFDGLIVPDLPLEEARDFGALAEQHGLVNVLLVAPTTPPDRRVEIASHSSGFIYFVSVAGITGERDRLPEATIQAVADLRSRTETPVCVGFGVSKPQMVRTVCRVADGAIVGSAIVHRIADAARAGTPRGELVRQVGDFVGELLGPILTGERVR